MSPVQSSPGTASSRSPDSLADVLERVLDKGIVVAGDIQINLVDVELLSIKLRLLVASADTARSMGIDWWQNDPFLSSDSQDNELARENAELRSRIHQLEERLEQALDPLPNTPSRQRPETGEW